jgi:predicted DNA-binding transcriptional regulator AlpA
MNDELLGLAELAELYGVTKATASNWSRRHTFPQPVQHLKMGPIWRKSEVIAWRAPRPDYRIAIDVPCSTCGLPLTGKPEPLTISLGFRIWCECGQDTDIYIITTREGTSVISEGWEPK